MTRDLRKYARRTRARLILGLFMLVFVLGDGLIYLIYGKNAALMGLLCLMAALLPVGIIILVLTLMDWIVSHADSR